MITEDVVAQIETATQADPELDRKIHAIVCGSFDRYNPSIPSYTRSLDVALTLVPDGSSFCIGQTDCISHVDGRNYTAAIGRHRVWAHSPALAVVAACLKARREKKGSLQTPANSEN